MSAGARGAGRPRRAVVTGGAGFLGSHLCDRLLTEDYEVFCVDNLLTGSLENLAEAAVSNRFHFIRADVSEAIPVPDRVDAVLHLASPASPVAYADHPLETLRAGSAGTHNALELARRNGARFLLASTSEVYGNPMVHPQHESYWGNVNPVGPRSVYDEAKRYAEAVTAAYRRSHRVDTAIARFFNTYGPRMRPGDGRAVPTFIEQALRNEPLTVAGDGSQTRSACFVDDLVDGIIRLLMSDLAGPVNLGNPEEVTVAELAATIIALAGSRSRVGHIPRPVDDPDRRRPDIAAARRDLGWAPATTLREGLERTIAWRRAALRDALTASPS
jgi:dTDP-glucose 4,6-dehydratase